MSLWELLARGDHTPLQCPQSPGETHLAPRTPLLKAPGNKTCLFLLCPKIHLDPTPKPEPFTFNPAVPASQVFRPRHVCSSYFSASAYDPLGCCLLAQVSFSKLELLYLLFILSPFPSFQFVLCSSPGLRGGGLQERKRQVGDQAPLVLLGFGTSPTSSLDSTISSQILFPFKSPLG